MQTPVAIVVDGDPLRLVALHRRGRADADLRRHAHPQHGARQPLRARRLHRRVARRRLLRRQATRRSAATSCSRRGAARRASSPVSLIERGLLRPCTAATRSCSCSSPTRCSSCSRTSMKLVWGVESYFVYRAVRPARHASTIGGLSYPVYERRARRRWRSLVGLALRCRPQPARSYGKLLHRRDPRPRDRRRSASTSRGMYLATFVVGSHARRARRRAHRADGLGRAGHRASR